MKILDKYVIKQFSVAFFFALSCFTIIVIVSQFFDKIDTFLNYKTPAPRIIIYLLYRLPFWLVQVMPVAMLLATLFSLSNFLRSNELTAMKASGMSLYRILLPLFIFSLTASAATFFFQENLASPLAYKAKLYEKQKIRHEAGIDYLKRQNFVYYVDNKRLYYIRFFDGENSSLHDVQLDEFDEQKNFKRKILARSAQWIDNEWTFNEGVIREFSSDGKTILGEEKFGQKVIAIPETPADFQREDKKTDEMNYRELRYYIERLRRSGIPFKKEQVEYYLRFSYPFANFIILLLGVPFALWSRQANKIVNFGTGMVIAFIFWGMIEVGHALGESKILIPSLAAWVSNILFGSLGVWLIVKKVRK